MGRTNKVEADGLGHNSGVLSDDDLAALELWFERKIRAQQKKAEVAKAAFEEERGQVNDLFARLRSELRIKRKDFEQQMADADLSEAEFRAKELERFKRYQRRGLPVGTQLTLDFTADTVTDQQMAEADGRRAYLAFADRLPPDTVATFLHPDWLRGYDDEMTKVAERMGRAEAIIAEREQVNAQAEAVDLNGEEPAEEEPDLSEEAIAAKARKLKRTEFMERGTTGGEVDQPEAA